MADDPFHRAAVSARPRSLHIGPRPVFQPGTPPANRFYNSHRPTRLQRIGALILTVAKPDGDGNPNEIRVNEGMSGGILLFGVNRGGRLFCRQ